MFDIRPKSIGRRIRRARTEALLTQGEVARLAGMHATTLSRLENGRQPPSLRTVRALSQALGCRPTWLATGEGRARSDPAPT